MKQMDRNLTGAFDRFLLNVRYLILDRDLLNDFNRIRFLKSNGNSRQHPLVAPSLLFTIAVYTVTCTRRGVFEESGVRRRFRRAK